MSSETSSSSIPGLQAFDYTPRTRLVFGVGVLAQLGSLARSLGGHRALVVTDPGLVEAGHAAKTGELLRQSGLEVACYDQVRENPTTRDVQQCLAVAKSARIDLIVGLGGGSSLDTAKGCNFLLTNGGAMQDYWGVGKATRPMLPFIAIPTTAGTGSECQSAALIADEVTHQKMACLDPKAAAAIAILDPQLTLSQPPKVTALTAVDALAHALETCVCNRRNALSTTFSRESFRLAARALPQLRTHAEDLEVRGAMLLSAALAGLAIENSMLGAAHAAANPLTARFGIPHGQAVGMMLPWVMRFNSQAPEAAAAYAELAVMAGTASVGDAPARAASALVEVVESWLDLVGMPHWLGDCGVRRDQLGILAEEAARQWTAGFNPVRVGQHDFADLYTRAFRPPRKPESPHSEGRPD